MFCLSTILSPLFAYMYYPKLSSAPMQLFFVRYLYLTALILVWLLMILFLLHGGFQIPVECSKVYLLSPAHLLGF